MPANLAIAINGKGELITAAIVGEEEQVVKGHVEFSEALICAECVIVFLDVSHGPHHSGTIVGFEAIELQQQFLKALGELNTKLPLNRNQLGRHTWLGKFGVWRSRRD